MKTRTESHSEPLFIEAFIASKESYGLKSPNSDHYNNKMPLHSKMFLDLDINQLNNIQELDENNFKSCDSCEVTPRVEHYLRKFDYNFISRPTVERLHSSSSFDIDVRFESYNFRIH